MNIHEYYNNRICTWDSLGVSSARTVPIRRCLDIIFYYFFFHLSQFRFFLFFFFLSTRIIYCIVHGHEIFCYVTVDFDVRIRFELETRTQRSPWSVSSGAGVGGGGRYEGTFARNLPKGENVSTHATVKKKKNIKQNKSI